MTRTAVSSAIAALEAISGTRALSNQESCRLEKLITVERRYDYSSAKPARDAAAIREKPGAELAPGPEPQAPVSEAVARSPNEQEEAHG